MHVPGAWTLARAAFLRDAVERDLIHALPGLHPRIELLPSGQEPFSERMTGITDHGHAVTVPTPAAR
jgi:hypothetical protein